MIFAWDEINREHIGRHDVNPSESEFVVEYAKPPFPRAIGDGKFIVWGTTGERRPLQVVYVHKTAEEVAFDSLTSEDWEAIKMVKDTRIIRGIHAMELSQTMKRRFRRQGR